MIRKGESVRFDSNDGDGHLTLMRKGETGEFLDNTGDIHLTLMRKGRLADMTVMTVMFI